MTLNRDVFWGNPLIPEDFTPEDIISREMDINGYISDLKAEGIYNEATCTWTLWFGDKLVDSYYRPSLHIEPNIDEEGNFSPNVTYNSGDGKISITILNIKTINSSPGRMQIVGVADSEMVILKLTSEGFSGVSRYGRR